MPWRSKWNSLVSGSAGPDTSGATVDPEVSGLGVLDCWSMKKLAGYGTDDHPADDVDRAPLAWSLAALDDCQECADLRVELTVEEVGKPGTGLVGHLSPDTARKLRATLALALRDIGEDPGP